MGWLSASVPREDAPCLELATLHLALRNPGQAVALALAEPPDRQWGRLRATFRVLRAIDPAQAELLAQMVPERIRESSTAPNALEEPRATVDWALARAGRWSSLFSAFKHWARQDPAAALARAENLPEDETRRRALRGLVEGWAQADPAGALAWAGRVSTSTELGPSTVWGAFVGAAEAQPAAAAAWLAGRPRDASTERYLKALGRSWAATNFPAALTWLQGLSEPRDQRCAAFAFLAEWVQLDAPAALALAARLEPLEPRGLSLLEQAVAEWTQHDPAGVRGWIQTLPEGLSRTRALEGYVKASLATLDQPRELLDWLVQVRAEAVQTRTGAALLQPVIARLAEVDFAAAAAWTLQQPNRTVGAEILALLVGRQACTDLPGAIELVSEWSRRTAGTSRDILSSSLVSQVSQLAGRWAQEDPAASARWVDGLPPAVRHGSIPAAVAAAWAQRDPVAALQWAQQPGMWQPGAALLRIFEVTSARDPGAALALAASVQGVEQRRLVFRAIWDGWRSIDPVAAGAWRAREQPDLRPSSIPTGFIPGGDDD